ncbi:hypothetical protein L596_012384 [Steinernema carpocapsae]|uniref:Uncharacterized protein n=1 Tax=Steinernema carpocapsae TaxID=34508 RepID=A0A4U5NXA2_STECR|nr:hypothetical protein L596_012384 [Steinernema carpocapsae]
MARYDETCPNGGSASIETVATTCKDLLCHPKERCMQINPYFARCCGPLSVSGVSYAKYPGHIARDDSRKQNARQSCL